MRTLVWLIGKPGAGKTSVGELVHSLVPASKHFSFGQLLKEYEPKPEAVGYSLTTREKVHELLRNEAKTVDYLIVDGNPYPPHGFGFLDQVKDIYDKVCILQLDCNNDTAEERIRSRKRRVVLPHEGNVYADRIASFNNIVLPEIENGKSVYAIDLISTQGRTPKSVAEEIVAMLDMVK